jgi:hypothetical protein
MTRRVAILALPQVVNQGLQQFDQWNELSEAWNPFADKMNHGVLDMKQWKRVVKVIEKIEGCKCK